MKSFIGQFNWVKGSINDNIRNILTNKKIGYYNTFNGDIFTSGDNRKVVAENGGNNTYYVYIVF